MAVHSEGFSIRAYTAEMRDSGFGKCWPFDGGRSGEEDARLLPPISVRRFRWWLDELGAVRSHTVGTEARVSINNAVSADEVMAETLAMGEAVGSPPRNKRAPKKRSILELFAVAPVIETVRYEMNGADLMGEKADQHGGDGVHQARDPVAICRQDRKKPIRDYGRRGTRKKKMKQKKVRLEICASEKGKVGSLDSCSSCDQSYGPKHSSCNKQLKNLQKKLVGIQKDKQEKVKGPSRKDMLMYVKSAKLMCKKQELPRVIPLHSILKSWTQAASSGKGKACCLQDSAPVDIFCESAKHVHFSGVDDLLGRERSSTEIPQLQSPRKIVSDVLSASSSVGQSTVGDKCPPAAEETQLMNVSDNNIGTISVERIADASFERTQSSDSSVPANPYISTDHCRFSSDTDGKLFSGSLDLNCAVQECTDLNCLSNASPSLSPSRIFREPMVLNCSPPPIFNYHSDEQSLCGERLPQTFDPMKRSSCLSRNSAPSSDMVISSAPTVDPALHLSTPLKLQGTENKEQSHSSLNPSVDVLNLDPHFQLNGPFSPTNFTSYPYCSSDSNRYMESRLQVDPDNTINKERIGLPLTSKGEFIQLPLSSSFAYSELCNKQSSEMDSIHRPSLLYHVEQKSNNCKMKGKFPSVSPLQTNLPNQFLQQYCSVEAKSSGLDFRNFRHYERLKVQKHDLENNANHFSHVTPNELEVCCWWCSKHNQTQVDKARFHSERNSDDEFQPAFQQTMRLMGKNVTVGISKEREHFCNGKKWKDKEITKEISLSPGVADRSNLKQSTSETHSTCLHLECQSQRVSQSGISSEIQNHGFDMNILTHPYPAECSLESTSNSMVNFVLESSDGMMHQKLAAMSYFQNVCQHMLLSSTDCAQSQSVPYKLPSTSVPCFTDHSNSRFGRNLTACLSASLPNCWLTATQQGKMQQSSSYYYSLPVSAYQPCTMPANIFPLLPTFPPQMISFPLCSDGFSQANGLYAPASVVHPLSGSVFAASKSDSSANTMYRSKTKNNNSKFAYPSDLDTVNTIKRRPIDRNDRCTIALKKPNLIKEDSNIAVQQMSRGWLHGTTESDVSESEARVYGSRPTGIGLSVRE